MVELRIHLQYFLLACLASLSFLACQEQIIDDSQTETTTESLTQNDSTNDSQLAKSNTQCSESFDTFNTEIWPTLNNVCSACHTQTNNNTHFKFTSNNSHDSFLSTHEYISNHSTPDLFYKKPSNQIEHGGNIQIETNSSVYLNFLDFTASIKQSDQTCTYIDISDPIILNTHEIEGINRLSIKQIYQKSLLTLTGNIPTNQELDAISNINEYKTELRKAMTGDEFTNFLMIGANDQLLTLKFANYQSFALDTINGWIYEDIYTRLSKSDQARDLAQKNVQDLINTSNYEFPLEEDPKVINAQKQYETLAQENWDTRKKINRAIAEEPLRLIAHVVQNNRPYTEVLTADYMMLNGYSNDAFNGQYAIENLSINDDTTWVEGYIASHRFLRSTNYGKIDQSDIDFSHYSLGHVPNSGILSSPAFLMRFPSTDTNKNRARARWTYQFFLGVDIERLIQRAQDPIELATVSNPNTAESSCYGCHIIMDPVAGAFQSFGDSGAYLETAGTNALPWSYINTHPSYQKDDTWYRDNIAPGINGKDINEQNKYGKIEDKQFVDPIQWLGNQIIQDERFATATVKFWYPSVMNHELLLPPEDTQSDEYLAYQIQENTITELAKVFEQSNFDLKTLLIEMTLTDIFTANGLESAQDDRTIELSNIGIGNLLTPEQIDNKVTSITGQYWTYNWSPDTHKLLEDYYLFLGGIDSDKITQRTREINTMMIQSIERMAQEMSCKIVLDEFNLDSKNRKLFTLAGPQTTPYLPESYFVQNEDLNTDIIATLEISEERIVKQIQKLYQLFLNENLEADDPEITAIYNLWTDVWQSRLSNPDTYGSVHNGDNDNPDYQENCEVNWDDLDWDNIVDWNDLTDIKSHLGEFYNPENTIRAWSAVLIYLMTDYQFIHQ